jgi:hypothetical protein
VPRPEADAVRRGQAVAWTIGAGGVAVAVTLAVAVVTGFGRRAPEASSVQALPSVSVAERLVACHGESQPLPSALAGDPCRSATVAVEVAVAAVGLPIAEILIEPGPFYCDVLWPGVQSPNPCYASFVRPGQFMHAWVRFTGSDEVAVVALGLDLPADLDIPGATRPPWNATLVRVEVPPAGWVMP